MKKDIKLGEEGGGDLGNTAAGKWEVNVNEIDYTHITTLPIDKYNYYIKQQISNTLQFFLFYVCCFAFFSVAVNIRIKSNLGRKEFI